MSVDIYVDVFFVFYQTDCCGLFLTELSVSPVTSQGSQILSGLSAEDHRAVLLVIKRAILSTDLTVYMEYVKAQNVTGAIKSSLCKSCNSLIALVWLRSKEEERVFFPH